MKKLLGFLAIAFLFTSCSDDKNVEELTGKNTVSIEFDSSFKGDDLVLGNSYTNGNGEKITVKAFDYIVSNFVLVTKDGTEFTYPKEDSFFIISEGGGDKTKNLKVSLKNVPAGKYTKIKFGIGVDKARYLEGQAAQEDFWQKAANYALTWSWQAGYKFVVLEGNFTRETVTDASQFWLHIASRGSTVDLYKEVELSMDDALVSTTKSPQIHVVVDANKMLDGTNKIKLSDGNSIMGGDKAGLIADNNVEMFSVHHVHNGSDSHHTN